MVVSFSDAAIVRGKKNQRGIPQSRGLVRIGVRVRVEVKASTRARVDFFGIAPHIS